jgi:glycosyltransferase involved in cell wall biosynthesis
MRVLYITTNFPRWEGDAHSPWIVEIIKRLREREVSVEVLAPSYAGLADHIIDGIQVYRFRYAPARWETLTHNEGAPNKIRNPLYLLLVPTYLLAGLWRTVALCRRGRYDVIHVHWPLPSGIFGLAGKWRGQGRLVASFHGAELLLTKRFPFLKPILAYIIKHTDAVTSNSSFTAGLIRQLAGPGCPVHVIPYGSRVEIKDAPPTDGTTGRLLFVGRLIERKGLPYLIEAVGLLAASRSLHLDVVGEGNLMAEWAAQTVRRGLSETVTFHGHVDDRALADLYGQCDMFVLPSIVDAKGDTEGLGVVLLEAMSYRKPVVATEVGGIPDIVRNGETGLLVPQRNAAALADAIGRLLDDPVLAQQLGEAGAAFVQQNFDWEHIVDRIEALYTGQESLA